MSRLLPCPVCGSDAHAPFSERGRYPVVACRSCDLHFVNPIPDRDETESTVSDSAKYTDDQIAKKAFFERRAHDLFDRLERRRKPGLLLDVGCAIGTQVEVGLSRGWDCRGLELSRTSYEVARKAGLPVERQSLEEAGFADGQFDVITANHVLEHIPDVVPFITELFRILARGGLLFFSVPNLQTWWFFLKGDRYGWTFQDDHFSHFSIRTLPRLLERHGFTILEAETSRWRDFHEPLESHGRAFQTINRWIERGDLGIEVFCLARKP